MITIEINSDEISAALGRLVAQLEDLSPIMNKVGAVMRDQTEDRFKTERAPDGKPWAPRSPVTIANYLRKRQRFGGILHLTGQLGGNIFHTYGRDFAEVGSAEPYAAMMQFGGSKSAFPHLWGNIPSRAFLGLSPDDETEILDTISEALGSSLTP